MDHKTGKPQQLQLFQNPEIAFGRKLTYLFRRSTFSFNFLGINFMWPVFLYLIYATGTSECDKPEAF